MSISGTVIQDPLASSEANGTLNFNANGELINPATDVAGITFAGLSDSAAALDLNWNLYGSTGTAAVSQTSLASSTSSTSQNGYPSGTYESFKVDSSGVISAQFSNDQSQIVGQLAVATVANEEGMKIMGSTNYAANNASGTAAIGVAGTGGRGIIEDSELEA
jgi:flagellar hook protein FlgE